MQTQMTGHLEVIKMAHDLNVELDDNEKRTLGRIMSAFIAGKESKQATYDLAKFCLAKFHIITIRESDEIYIYHDGIYEPLGHRKLATYIQKGLEFGSLITTHVFNELCGYIKRATYRGMADITEPEELICLANGILDLNALKVLPHSPDYIFFSKLPVTYMEGADCLKIKKFLQSIVANENVLILQEVIGYCLLKAYPIQKAVMLVGKGANGKSTFINLIKTFLGHQNCVSISLQALESNRFAAANLHGKLANLCADLPRKALSDTGMFKKLTGGDILSAEKKFKDTYSFTNYSKQIFSTNKVPQTPDESEAFIRRWIIIGFPNQFIGGNDNKSLLKELTTPDELSGLLNFAIEGLKRMLKIGDFSNAQSIEVVKEDYTRQSDSASAFIMDCISPSLEGFIQKQQLYAHYADYCRSKDYPILSSPSFHRQLLKRISVEEYRPTITKDGKEDRPWCWKGIKVDVTKIRKKTDLVDEADGNVQKVQDVQGKSHLNENGSSEIW